ncbi:MAG TPA: NAD(P)-dependent alcohol dehydrogenase, partial [Steroidobacteraceae bacterium]|nr:NAD(P)-dependent alcohol dehydrogenase [Steroidobacteraceae bacterium]
MKTRNKVFAGIAAVFVVGFSALAIAISYDAACPPIQPLATDVDSTRAVMQRCYGVPHGLRIEQIAKPVPGEGQVLIQVHASSVNPAEWYGTSGQPYVIRLFNGIGAPKKPRAGFDVAGTVAAIGPNVTAFKPGDEVFGGVGGAFAEYALAREAGAIVAKPANMSFDEAAAMPIAAITALQGLRDHGGIAAGQKVLINGASGGVGTYAVQIAKSFGAEVTGVTSTRNVELVRSLGADHVIDYTQANFTEGTERYDLILDNVGNHGFSDLENVVKPEGVIVVVGGSKKDPFLGPIKRVLWTKMVAHFIDPRLTFFIASVNKADLEVLAALAREGKLKSVID